MKIERQYQPFGTRLEGEARSDLFAAMVAAGINYWVEKKKIFTEDGSEIPNFFATVRADNGKPIGIVGNFYSVVQNSEAFLLAKDIIEVGGGELDYAGHFRNGGVAYIGIDLGNIFPEDPVKRTLLIINSFDGSIAVSGKILSTRLVCWNMVFSQGNRIFRINHTKSAEERLAIVRKMLAESEEIKKYEVKIFTSLMKKRVSKILAERALKKILDVKDKRKEKRKMNKVKRVIEIYESSPAIIGTPAEGNAWGLFNALTEWHQYELGRKSSEREYSYILNDAVVSKFQQKAIQVLLEN